MGFRRVRMQIWAITAILWLSMTGIIAGSAYLQTSFTDQVKLEQQAKDIRAAGGDPAAYQWGGPVQVGQFVVPPVQLEMQHFWQEHGRSYAVLGLSLPLTSLMILEVLARLIEGFGELRQGARSKRGTMGVAAG